MASLLAAQSPEVDPIDLAREDFGRFVRRFDGRAMDGWFAALTAPSMGEGLVAPGYAEPLARAIRAAVEARRPASMIRLGDGEGNVLAACDAEFPALADESSARISKLMFGEALVEAMQSLAPAMSRAVQNATVLGIPCAPRIGDMKRLVEEQLRSGAYDLRGISGGVNALRCSYALLLDDDPASQRIVTNCYFHRDLLPHYGEILGGLETVGLISCFEDLPGRLEQRFGIGRVDYYPIPPQALNIGRQPDARHYPDRFDELLASLKVHAPGQVVLVAAGVLGKIYCERARELGGIGIDVGSIADVWVGRSARQYQSQDFVARWTL